MKIATSTEDFGICKTDIERITELKRCGFTYVDLSLYDGMRADWQYFAPDWQEKILALRDAAAELGVQFVQAHAPGGNPISAKDHDLLLASTIRSLEICRMLGIPNIVYHAGWETGVEKEEYFARNLAFVKELLPTVEKTGVTLCVENSTKVNMKDMYYFFTGASMREFVELVDHPLFGVCWDTGHANIEGHQYDEILALGDTLKMLHINDNMGGRDEHLLPYSGTLNVDEVMNALLDVGYKGYFTFEAGHEFYDYPGFPNKRHTFKRDTRALNPSLEIHRKKVETAYVIGKYILSQYHCFEE